MGGGGSGRRRRAWLGGMTATTADFMDFILYMLYIFLIFSVHCHSGEFKIGLGGTNGDNVCVRNIFFRYSRNHETH